MDHEREQMIRNKLWNRVIATTGAERWEGLLRCLAQLETSTGQRLRRLPRQEPTAAPIRGDDSSPLWLFAPDTDKEGRQFAFVVGGHVFYSAPGAPWNELRRYTVCENGGAKWWRGLAEHHQQTLLSVLGYILLSLDGDEILASCIQKFMPTVAVTPVGMSLGAVTT